MWIRGDVTGKCLISNEIRNDQVRGAAPGLYRSRTAGTGWFLCQAGKCLVTQRSQRSQAMIASFFSRPKTGITVFQFCTNRIVDPAQNNLPSAAQNPGQNFSPGLQNSTLTLGPPWHAGSPQHTHLGVTAQRKAEQSKVSYSKGSEPHSHTVLHNFS